MKKQFVPVFVVGVLGICALLLADVKTDYNHSTDFGKYKTYSWIKVQAGNQLWQDRIKNDVDQTLQSKGWQLVPSTGDASLTAFGATHEQQTLNTFYNNLGGGWYWGGFGEATTTEENTPVGTLVVDIFDTPTKHLIWRSVATNTLSGDPEKNAKKLQKTVDDMFKNFPPKPKG
ncbi:MAG TPA: DUF4136 domain-containing protein [Bryobacteraceae bacterium]|jgi:hypothetical protein|nr:DUF4136 domain-containing protein [Bryobacteraceae bacterium]